MVDRPTRGKGGRRSYAPALPPQKLPADVAHWVAYRGRHLRVPPSVLDAIEAARIAGWNLQEIADALGVTYPRAKGIRQRHRLGKPARSGQPSRSRAAGLIPIDLFPVHLHEEEDEL